MATTPTSSPPLVGRVLDRASIATLFNEGARLVTIVGPGGMGKTRLATCFAEEQRDAYGAPGDGGVWFVDLTSTTSVAGMCAAVAAALGVRLGASKDESKLVAQTGRALDRRGRVLVVLDNFETLAAEAAGVTAALLRAAPRARLLVTSRVALEIEEEHRWLLQGLAVPAPFDSLESPVALDSLLRVESIELFVRRARQVRPDLVIDEGIARTAGAIAARLDGIPLALELAAARLAVVSIEQLDDLLAAGRDDVLVRPRDSGRHGSMRTVVTDSLGLLAPRARAMLVGCAVFAGGFDLAAAEAVLGEAAPVLETLETLVAHSLVQLEASRHSLYEVVREVALAELERDTARAAVLRARHAAWFASQAAKGAARADLRNYLRAHATLTALPAPTSEEIEGALVLALAVEQLDLHGDLAQRLEVLDQALALVRKGGGASSSARSFTEVLVARGRAHVELGAFDSAAADFEQAMALAVANADVDLEAAIHVRIGEVVEARGDTASAREHFAAALAHPTKRGARPSHDRASLVREAEARAALAHAYRREGKLAEADGEIVASIAAHRAAKNDDGLCSAVFEAGVLSLFRRAYPSAGARFDEALELARRLGAKQREASIMTARGTMEQELGNVQYARDSHEAAVTIFRDAGNLYAEASTLYYLGGAHLEIGQADDAEAVLAAALAIVRSIGVPRYEALILGARGAQHAMAGHVDEAAALMDAADGAAGRCPTEPTLEAALAIHRLQLGVRSASTAARAARLAAAQELAASRPCDDPRFALRLLVLGCAKLSSPDATVERDGPAALIVHADGKSFRLPPNGGADAEIDLRRRAPLARILHELARRRVESPGEAMRVEDLLGVGWPDERVRYDAGANRVYVALAELRKLGLREWIVSDTSGYRLVTSRRVVLER